MQYDKRMMQADGTVERAGAGNEKRKMRRMKDIHVQPPAVRVSQQQQWVQTANDGKSAKEPGGRTAAPDPVREKPLAAGG